MRYSVINIRPFVHVVNEINGREVKVYIKSAWLLNTSMPLFIIRGHQYFEA